MNTIYKKKLIIKILFSLLFRCHSSIFNQYNKKTISEKSPEKVKIFDTMRQKINSLKGRNNTNEIYRFSDHSQITNNTENLSPSLQEKINIEKVFGILHKTKEKKKNSIPLSQHTEQSDLLQIHFLSKHNDSIDGQLAMQEIFQGTLFYSFAYFFIHEYLKEGKTLKESIEIAIQIITNSHFFAYCKKNHTDSILNYLTTIQDHYFLTENKTSQYNNIVEKILNNIRIFNCNNKIEKERALNQFYNIASRKNIIGVFSGYNKTKFSSTELMTTYGDMSIDKNIYNNFLLPMGTTTIKDHSLFKKRSFLLLGKKEKQETFYFIASNKNNIAQYFTPQKKLGETSIEGIFDDITNKKYSICSLLFLDEEKIKFLFSTQNI